MFEVDPQVLAALGAWFAREIYGNLKKRSSLNEKVAKELLTAVSELKNEVKNIRKDLDRVEKVALKV